MVTKHVKVDTFFYIGSQANQIFEVVVKELNLETTLHHKPYMFKWVCNDTKIQVIEKCKLRFSIKYKFVDKVELEVVPFDICGIILGSPYLFDRKDIYYRKKNMYHFFMNGIEYII